MKGADEYYDLFNGKSQQYGRLYLQLNTHARGKCFEIKLMPEGMIGSGDYVSGNDVVELYGMTGGHRGWTETYGWLHFGKWQEDFFAIVEQKKAERAELMADGVEREKLKTDQSKKNTSKLLAAYT